MSDLYVLNDLGEPVPEPDIQRWGEAFADGERRTVARDEIGDVAVSTVFLGMDHGWGDGDPLLYETMVFGGPLDSEQDRYTSRAAAVAGHAAMLARVRAALYPERHVIEGTVWVSDPGCGACGDAIDIVVDGMGDPFRDVLTRLHNKRVRVRIVVVPEGARNGT